MTDAFQRHANLRFQRRGQVWRASHTDPNWPIKLYARDIYYGTGRLLAQLTLARQDDGMPEAVRILTDGVDLLTAAQRKRFATEASERLNRAQGGDDDKKGSFSHTITTMVDAMLEKLLEVKHEIEVADVLGVELPSDLTPKYAVWPLVPVARPGMLVAPSGSGKSTLACGVGLSVSHDTIILPGIEPRISGPVIYIGQEEDALQMRIRVEMLSRGHDIKLRKDRFIFMKLRHGSLIDSAERVAEAVVDYRAVLVIIDSAQATWGDGGDAVREYASRWFSAVERLDCPTLVIEHPNLAGTKKDSGSLEAAGTSVKRDRSGHVWTVKSVELPVRPGYPYRYHVTLMDSKRNYVGRQPDITYETVVNGHEWTRFMPADAITAESIVDGSRMWAIAAGRLRDLDEDHQGGWTVAELAALLGAKDDRRIRQELSIEAWRPREGTGFEERPVKVEGTGLGKNNPARYVLETRLRGGDPVQLSMAPGDPETLS